MLMLADEQGEIDLASCSSVGSSCKRKTKIQGKTKGKGGKRQARRMIHIEMKMKWRRRTARRARSFHEKERGPRRRENMKAQLG